MRIPPPPPPPPGTGPALAEALQPTLPSVPSAGLRARPPVPTPSASTATAAALSSAGSAGVVSVAGTAAAPAPPPPHTLHTTGAPVQVARRRPSTGVRRPAAAVAPPASPPAPRRGMSDGVTAAPDTVVQDAGDNSEDEALGEAGRAHDDAGALREREKLFERALRKTHGFFIRRVRADGACLFRAAADQIYGDEDLHATVRREVVEHLVRHLRGVVLGPHKRTHAPSDGGRSVASANTMPSL
jgi:hypothetical protein